MQESLMMGKKSGVKSGGPYFGFNFDQKRSVGQIVTGADRATDSWAAFGTGGQLPDYTGGVRLLNKVCNLTPLANVADLGNGDFTVEFYAWISTVPNNYISLFAIRSDGCLAYIGFGDSGWGNRLHLCCIPNSQNQVNAKYFTANLTQANARNVWRHYAMVRKNGKVRIYLDGVQVKLAAGLSTSFTVDEFESLDTFTTGTQMNLGSTIVNTDIYMPEFLVYNFAKYDGNFTRPKGPIAPLA